MKTIQNIDFDDLLKFLEPSNDNVYGWSKLNDYICAHFDVFPFGVEKNAMIKDIRAVLKDLGYEMWTSSLRRTSDDAAAF